MGLDLIKRAERADLVRLRKLARVEAKAERRAAREARRAARKADWAGRWPRWAAWWELRAKEAKTAATIVASATAIVVGLPRATKPAVAVGHWVHRVWTFYSDRDVGKPAQPPPNGGASLAPDRVPRPPPPGSPTPTPTPTPAPTPTARAPAAR